MENLQDIAVGNTNNNGVYEDCLKTKPKAYDMFRVPEHSYCDVGKSVIGVQSRLKTTPPEKEMKWERWRSKARKGQNCYFAESAIECMKQQKKVVNQNRRKKHSGRV